MIKSLLTLQGRLSTDAADALAIAVCHAQHRGMPQRRAGGRR
jgi:Holliday junction resolvasome RuvABC endonuclease subunit